MKNKFKGGPVLLNSGGFGPDDWLLKTVEGGRWTLVIFRWGRHWRGREIGEDAADRLSETDREALLAILHAGVERVCVGDLAQRLEKMRNVPTLGAAEFWRKYEYMSNTKRR